jgi:hypothetical protein
MVQTLSAMEKGEVFAKSLQLTQEYSWAYPNSSPSRLKPGKFIICILQAQQEA